MVRNRPRSALHVFPRCDDEPDRMCNAQPSGSATLDSGNATGQPGCGQPDANVAWAWEGVLEDVLSPPTSPDIQLIMHKRPQIVPSSNGVNAHGDSRLQTRSRWGSRFTLARVGTGTTDYQLSIPSKAFETDDIPVAACPPTLACAVRHQHRQPTFGAPHLFCI
jgi:hypothetical protein